LGIKKNILKRRRKSKRSIVLMLLCESNPLAKNTGALPAPRAFSFLFCFCFVLPMFVLPLFFAPAVQYAQCASKC